MTPIRTDVTDFRQLPVVFCYSERTCYGSVILVQLTMPFVKTA